MKALVVGAGIGALTTALSLHAAGIDVDLVDSVTDAATLNEQLSLAPQR